MNTLWFKIRDDLFAANSGTPLAVISIAVGVLVMGTLFGMMGLQLKYMDLAQIASRPSAINFILQRPVTAADLDALRSMPELTSVEPQQLLSLRFHSLLSENWQSGTLVMRPDYLGQEHDRLQLLEGEWPNADSIAVERLTASKLGLKVGDTVWIELPSGPVEWVISGLVRHPFVKPPALGGQLHFFASQQGLINLGLVADEYRQLGFSLRDTGADIYQVASDLKRYLGNKGIGVYACLFQNESLHWGRPFMLGIHYVLRAMAIAALLLSVMLSFNTLMQRMTLQAHQIGILRSLGIRLNLLMGCYLLEAGVMGGLAVLIALPFGLLGAWCGSSQLLNLFNIDLPPYAIDAWAPVYMLLGGWTVPVLAALWPVVLACRMPIISALGNYGLGADYAVEALSFRCVERIMLVFFPILYVMSLVNLMRRKLRFILTQLVIIAAIVLFLVVMTLRTSLNLTLENDLARSAYTLKLGFVRDQSPLALAKVVSGLPGLAYHEAWLRSPVELRRHGQSLRLKANLGAQAFGVPEGSRLFQPLVVEGRWLMPEDQGRRMLVLNAETAEAQGIRLGDALMLAFPGRDEQAWQVTGLYRWVSPSAYAVEPVYVPAGTLQKDAGDLVGVSQLLLEAAPVIGDPLVWSDQVMDVFTLQGIAPDPYTTTTWDELKIHSFRQFLPVIAVLLGVAVMMLAVGGIGLAGALMLSVMQRGREFGVLRALGASPSVIMRICLLEGVFQSLLAWVLSLPVAAFLAPLMVETLGQTMLHLQLDYQFSWNAVWMALGLSLVIAVFASMGPAFKAARRVVREGLNAGT